MKAKNVWYVIACFTGSFDSTVWFRPPFVGPYGYVDVWFFDWQHGSTSLWNIQVRSINKFIVIVTSYFTKIITVFCNALGMILTFKRVSDILRLKGTSSMHLSKLPKNTTKYAYAIINYGFKCFTFKLY